MSDYGDNDNAFDDGGYEYVSPAVSYRHRISRLPRHRSTAAPAR